MIRFRKAVLIVHGFAGGTYDQEYLSNHLEISPKLDVYTYTLPGHDKVINNKSTMEEWINKSEEEVEFLINNGYKTIYVIGHSMGGVIASHLASKYKQIKKVVLVAPAFKYLNFNDGDSKILNVLKTTPGLLNQYGKDEVASRVVKLPARTIKEFMKLVDKYQDTLNTIDKPCLIVQGEKDKIVPKETAKYVFNKLYTEDKKIVYLRNTTHDVFREGKKEAITKVIEKFLLKGNKKIKDIKRI